MLGKKKDKVDKKAELKATVADIQPPKMPEDPKPETQESEKEYLIPELVLMDDIRKFHQNFLNYANAILFELQEVKKVLISMKDEDGN